MFKFKSKLFELVLILLLESVFCSPLDSRKHQEIEIDEFLDNREDFPEIQSL